MGHMMTKVPVLPDYHRTSWEYSLEVAQHFLFIVDLLKQYDSSGKAYLAGSWKTGSCDFGNSDINVVFLLRNFNNDNWEDELWQARESFRDFLKKETKVLRMIKAGCTIEMSPGKSGWFSVKEGRTADISLCFDFSESKFKQIRKNPRQLENVIPYFTAHHHSALYNHTQVLVASIRDYTYEKAVCEFPDFEEKCFRFFRNRQRSFYSSKLKAFNKKAHRTIHLYNPMATKLPSCVFDLTLEKLDHMYDQIPTRWYDYQNFECITLRYVECLKKLKEMCKDERISYDGLPEYNVASRFIHWTEYIAMIDREIQKAMLDLHASQINQSILILCGLLTIGSGIRKVFHSLR